ncbi:MAG: PAS domain-containing protein [Proteobacteria bacterium]|nr:PAS domain-containing protein [Pseudomonadota bacterium]
MFHSNTELLIDYWREKRGAALLPARTDIDPADFAHLLPQTFIVGRTGPGQFPVRLAGEFVVDLHGRGLRGDNILNLWTRLHRVELQSALDGVLRDPEPLVISADARTDDGLSARLEILFAPLVGATGRPDRFVGLYQPTSAVHVLRGRPVRELLIRAVGGADLRATPRLRLAALDGRLIA